MRNFSIKINTDLDIFYNHYLSDDLVNDLRKRSYFKKWYSLRYWSRKFDKSAAKWNGGSAWWLDNKRHRVGKPAMFHNNGEVECWENGRRIK